MKEFFCNSVFFGVMISILAYELGMFLKKKFKFAFFNPLLISIIVVILVLTLLHVDYDSYNAGGKYLSYLLTPATVCLAIPLYEQLAELKKKFCCHYRRHCLRYADQPDSHTGTFHTLPSEPSAIRYPASEIHHYRHRYGSFRRAGRHRDHHGGGDHDHRHFRQYLGRGHL